MSQPVRTEPKRVAAIVTEYRRWSHADVIVSKILEGYDHDGKDYPGCGSCRFTSISFPRPT